MTGLYSRYRAHIAAKSKEDQLSHENETCSCVFSELVAYIFEKSNNTSNDKPTVFNLAELVGLYRERHEQFDKDIPDMNQALLKERISAKVPGQTSHQEMRDILLTFEKDVGTVLSEASSYTDGHKSH